MGPIFKLDLYLYLNYLCTKFGRNRVEIVTSRAFHTPTHIHKIFYVEKYDPHASGTVRKNWEKCRILTSKPHKYKYNEHKNGVNASFSVQSKTFSKVKAQSFQMRSKNVQEGSRGRSVEFKRNPLHYNNL